MRTVAANHTAAAAATTTRTARRIAALLAVATVLVLVGTLIERHGHHDTSSTTATTVPASTEVKSSESGEAGESTAQQAGEAGESAAQRAAEGGGSEASEFHPLGVNIEKAGLVAVGIAIPLLIAAALALRPRRELFALAALAALAFVILDIAEFGHQANVHRWGLVVVAAIAIVLHATVTGMSANALRPATRAATTS